MFDQVALTAERSISVAPENSVKRSFRRVPGCSKQEDSELAGFSGQAGFPPNQGMSILGGGYYLGDAIFVYGTAGVPKAQPKCNYYYPKDFGTATLQMTKPWVRAGVTDWTCPSGSVVGAVVQMEGGTPVGVPVKVYRETNPSGAPVAKLCYYSTNGGPGSLN